jgi:uncharacterized protein (PEP-CTERM system associated)
MTRDSGGKRAVGMGTKPIRPVRIIPLEILRKVPGHAACLLLLALAPVSGALADKWTISPSITARETYTDNASFSSGSSNGSFVTQVTPGLHATGEGPRFKANFNYTPTATFYSYDSSQDRLYNFLSADGTVEAIRNFFYIDGSGNISQTYISPFAPQPTNTYTVTNNRVESRSYSVSPYFRGVIDSGYTYEARYRYSATSSNNNSLADTYTTDWTGHLASPIALFGWRLDYENNTFQYRYSNQEAFESKSYRGTIFYKPDPQWLFSVNAGEEQNNYALPSQTQTYNNYGGGVSWKPTPTASADANWEHRYFGSAGSARLDDRTRLTAWTVSYTKDESNYPTALLTLPPGNTAALLNSIFLATIPDPAARQAAVNQFLLATGTPAFLSNQLTFYTQQIYIQERFDASMGILGKRSSVFFNVFHTNSRAVTSFPYSSSSNIYSLAQGATITQNGFGVSANHNITPFTSLGANAIRTRAEQDTPSTTSWNDSFFLTVNHTVSPKTYTFGGLSYTHFTSSGATVSSSASDARSVYVGFTHNF